MPVTFDFPLSLLPVKDGVGEDELDLVDLGLKLGLDFSGDLDSLDSTENLGEGVALLNSEPTDGLLSDDLDSEKIDTLVEVKLLCWLSKVPADNICSEMLEEGITEEASYNLISSGFVKYRFFVGVSGSIWMTVWHSTGGVNLLSFVVLMPGVLGSEGSWDDNLNGRVCSDSASEPVDG